MNPIPTILWDLDGTTIKSEELKGRAHALTISELGGNASSDFYREILGQSREAVAAAFLNEAGLVRPIARYLAVYKRVKRRLLREGNILLQPGVRDVLLGLKPKAQLALVTSSPSVDMAHAVGSNDIDHVFTTFVCADDVPAHMQKPHPAPYARALRSLAASCYRPVAIEDTPAGIASAQAAGCYTFAVKHDYNSRLDLSSADEPLYGFSPPKDVVELIMHVAQHAV